MITGFVPVETILAKLYRDLGINQEIDELSVVEWCYEALRMIGAYHQFEEISECITLTDGKAELPCGFYRLVDINIQGYPVSWASNQNMSNYQCEGCRITPCCTDYTFYINDRYLITNLNQFPSNQGSTQKACIVYLGIPTDDKGYPMVPDDIYYQKALASYVTYMMDYQNWRKGKTPDKVMMKAEKDWLFYVNSARGSANMPGLAQLEAIKNVWTKIRPTGGEYGRHFANNNKTTRRIY